MDAAIQRVQNAGYSLADAGGSCIYYGGYKNWYIPVTTADGIRCVVVSFDGAYYNMVETDW